MPMIMKATKSEAIGSAYTDPVTLYFAPEMTICQSPHDSTVTKVQAVRRM